MLILFSIFVVIHEPPSVRYSSVIQIKNVYSKNRLTVTTETGGIQYQQPTIYSTRPPFDDGWTWVINPEEDNEIRLVLLHDQRRIYVDGYHDQVDNDQSVKYTKTEKIWICIHQFISISAISFLYSL